MGSMNKETSIPERLVVSQEEISVNETVLTPREKVENWFEATKEVSDAEISETEEGRSKLTFVLAGKKIEKVFDEEETEIVRSLILV